MIKNIVLALVCLFPLTAYAQEPPIVDATQTQSLLDALRECNERQTALLAEQRALGENILHIRERINQININLLGIQNNTQQIIVAHGGLVQVADFFKNNDKRMITTVLCFAGFGLLMLFYHVMRFGNWLFTPKKAAA